MLLEKINYPKTKTTIAQSQKKPRSPSALRLAIILLIQDPLLGIELQEEPLLLSSLKLPGIALFIEIMEVIKTYSPPNTGILLEYWRDRKERKLLEKLAQTEHAVPITGIKNEFLGAIEQLKKSAHTQKIDHLLAKASQNSLSFEEKKDLHELIHRIHSIHSKE